MTPSPPDLPKFLTGERHAVHLIGVAGSGMSGIAALLLELGHDVRGSDKARTLETERLAQLGLRFSSPHRAEDADGAELIIYSSAIKEDNPILAAARARKIPAIRRADPNVRCCQESEFPLRHNATGANRRRAKRAPPSPRSSFCRASRR
jgi:UDP-N-acetylmuramoylalanine-D-glutamate ligase